MIKTLALILLLTASAFAQSPDNDALFGTPNTRDDSSRIQFATNTDMLWGFSAYTFPWSNGPAGEENYLDNTFGFGYNVDRVGNKVVPGVVSFTFSNESKYRNGIAGQTGGFMSEHHFNWSSPDGLIKIRPFDFSVQYDTGDFNLAIHGKIHFYRQASNGGARFGILHDDGFFDLRAAPQGVIAFKNGAMGLLWMKADNSNSIQPIGVDNQNRVVISPWGYNIFLAAPVAANTIDASESFKVDGVKVVGNQCAAIPDSNGTAADNQRAINAILACMRSHGSAG